LRDEYLGVAKEVAVRLTSILAMAYTVALLSCALAQNDSAPISRPGSSSGAANLEQFDVPQASDRDVGERKAQLPPDTSNVTYSILATDRTGSVGNALDSGSGVSGTSFNNAFGLSLPVIFAATIVFAVLAMAGGSAAIDVLYRRRE
jgi:hypothetical protein